MNEICVVGTSWRHGDAQGLESYTIPEAERATRLSELRRRLEALEVVYLATCNRVEVVLIGDGTATPAEYRGRVHEALTGSSSAGEATRRLRIWAGESAVEHLFLVAAGLDSALVGEHEIPGQMRQAVELAREVGSLGSRLEWLFGETLRVGRSVRARTQFGSGRLSLAEIALERVRARLDEAPGAVALIGVSPMTQRCGERLAGEGQAIIVVNRDCEKGEALGATFGATARSLQGFLESPDSVAAVVSATGSPQPLLHRESLERLAAVAPARRGPLLVDLAVPPDVDATAAAAIGLEYVGMDEITAEARANSERRRADSVQARQLVDDALVALRRRLAQRAVSPVIAGLNQRYRETALASVDRLLRNDLAEVQADKQEGIRRWAETLARHLAHVPMVGLQALAAQSELEAIRTFLTASDDPEISRLADLAPVAAEAHGDLGDEEIL